MLWKADSLPEKDMAKPLYTEVRREVLDTVVRTRDLLTYRQRIEILEQYLLSNIRDKGKWCFASWEEGNLGNSQSSAVIYINISNTECNKKYKPIIYMLYMQITNVISQTSRLNFKLNSTRNHPRKNYQAPYKFRITLQPITSNPSTR
jgi:hypothetical protein